MNNPLLDDARTSGAIREVSIQLPSLGRFYDFDQVFKEGTDVEDLPVGTVSIMDEHRFSDPLLLATGDAIPKMIKHICPDITNPGMLAEVDVEAILLATRLASYGDTMKLKHRCSNPGVQEDGSPVCQHENNMNVNIEEFIMRYGALDFLDEFMLPLDDLKHKVQLRPVPYSRSIEIMMNMIKSNREFEKIGDVETDDMVFSKEVIDQYVKVFDTTIETSLASLVDSILFVETSKGQRVFDSDTIRDYLLNIPAALVKRIQDRGTELTKKLKQIPEIKYNCEKCGYENVVYLQMDAQQLFSQAEDSEAPRTSSAKPGNTGKAAKRQSRVSRK